MVFALISRLVLALFWAYVIFHLDGLGEAMARAFALILLGTVSAVFVGVVLVSTAGSMRTARRTAGRVR
ncbi:MAG TPA: hypothetical protein VFZ65_07745 [Planctomycetota bacterium]|nr:hypothetical protein [Planctomycetota bacterium]